MSKDISLNDVNKKKKNRFEYIFHPNEIKFKMFFSPPKDTWLLVLSYFFKPNFIRIGLYM